MEEPENLAIEDIGKVSNRTIENAAVLPWGAPADRQNFAWSEDVTPGEFVLRTLFAEFTVLAERKIDLILGEPLERPLSKSLQRGEDPQFDQLLNSLNVVAEFSLSSLLKILFKWYEKQQNGKTGETEPDGHKGKYNVTKPKGGSDSPKLQSKMQRDRDHLTERRDLAVDFVLCQVLIEVLKQLPVHPVDDEHVHYIESLSFRHFKQRDSYPSSPSAANGHIIAALYAEVIGVVGHARFQSVCKRFLTEFKEHQSNPAILINLIYGMKYLRIKLYPVEELEEAFLFMRECATMFIDAKDKDVKHAFAAMFVEILVPVAASANRELNVPALKNFVDMTYHHAIDMVRKNKHSHSIFPLVTVLLCVSQKAFFLGNWQSFLSTCLGTLKQRDVKMQRVALECLDRLVWVYTIRIKCESNTATVSRLRSITDTLFPRGSRTVIPREAPMIYFVKLIHFIAQEKLDFAMNDIVFDLLGVGRTSRQISPERMNIGLRAFFVIAESLQRKGGEAPPMPTTVGVLPSGNTVKPKKVTLLNLSESQATSIGLANYYHSIRKALDSIIRGLDAQVGKPMMMTNPHCSHKEPDDMITGERKPKIDLFRTCIAAIPRCIPEGMTKLELVELLSRLTVHMDEELRGLAFFALQSLVLDFGEWRKIAVLGFVNFILREIQDNFPALLDSALRMLLQLLSHWKTALSSGQDDKLAPDVHLELSAHALLSDKEVNKATVLHSVEGCAMVMLCSIRPVIRKLALIVLKEVRTLFGLMDPEENQEKPVLDVVDQVFPTVLEKSLQAVPQSEKLFPSPLGSVDIVVVNDRLSGNTDKETGEQTNIALQSYFWSTILAGLLEQCYLPELSPSAVQFSWPAVCNRLITVYSLFDQSVSGMDSITNLSSMYRGPKKTMNHGDLCLWRNYLVFACCTHPHSPPSRSESPDQDGGASSEGSETKGDSGGPPSPSMVDSLFRFVVPLLKSECLEVREAVIVGLGRTSPCSYRDFLDELNFLLREALDRRAESVRKRRKREALRAYLARVFELNAVYGCFADSASELVTEDGLSPTFVEYIDGTRLYLEGESEKDMTAIMQLRLHFSTFVYKMITSVPRPLQKSLLSEDLRCNLFFLFSSWCAHFGVKVPALEKASLISSAQSTDLELASLHAMCALLQCGAVFDSNGLATDGYLYTWLQTVLNSPKEKISLLGHDTLVHLLLNNDNIPSLLNWVIDKCYTDSKLVMSRCFRALTAAFTERSDYPCELIPMLNVVLFKTADPSVDLREKAAHLLQLLERRFFPYTPPSISCSAHCSYSQSQTTLTQVLAKAHPEITIPMFEEMTSRFETSSAAGQRCILQYMLPWLANIELVDVSSPSPPMPTQDVAADLGDEQLDTEQPVDLVGEGWGSVEATQIVLNNLFYITVKYDDYYSKEVEAAWTSLCSRWANNVHEVLSYVIAMAGVIGTSEALIHTKKVAVYMARANTDKTVDELMEELKLTETVASQFDRCDEPPYFRALHKTSSQDSVNEARKNHVTAQERTLTSLESGTRGKASAEDVDGIKDTRDERLECKDDRKEKADSLERSSIALHEEELLECCVPLAEPDEEDQIEELEENYEVYWAREWALLATRLAASGVAVPLPVPDEQRFFAPLPDLLPFAPTAASLYRCNFALMLLTEVVPDQTKVDWSQHLPLMLHLIFLALDHGKAVVYEHCKRLLVNLVVGLVCRGDHVEIAQSLYKFMTVSEQGLGNHGFHKSTWTLDAGSTVACSRSADHSAGAAGSQAEIERSPGGDVVNIVGAGADNSSLAAGSEAKDEDDDNVELDETATDANKSCPVEQVKALIDFLANSDCKPLWAFEDITPRSHKIRSAEQLEVFLASVVQVFQKSDAGAQVQEKLAKVALHWATSCSSRHYAGRSFQVFRALKVPLTWTMLSDVLSRLVESVGDSSEDVQGYVMEILFTMEAAVDWTHEQAKQPVNPTELEMDASYDMPGRMEDDQDIENLRNELTTLSKSVGDKSPLTDSWVKPLASFHRHTRSLSSGCELKRNSVFLSHIGRMNGHSQDLRTRSTSLMCLKTPSESLNPQSHADMSTRVFWIAASLLESDYEHEFLMAIVLINKVMTFLDWSKKDSRESLEKVQQKLKWTGFPGLQALLLKGLTNVATSEPSLRLLAKLTVFSDISIVDPSQASGFALNVLALLPHMLEHFEEPDEFSRNCANNIVQVCKRSSSLTHLGKVFSMYVDKSYGRPCSTWVEVVCKYIHVSYGHQSRTHIAFLLEVLERGPPSYQPAVLSVLCAMIPLTDFSSPSMRQFHNDTLRTISKYLKGSLWKESLDILKLAVSHSSNLDKPPPRPASSVMDNCWSADPAQMKKELPGRTLDFTFELSATRVVGGCPTALEAPGESGKECKTSAADMSGWRKPGLSQRRTRDRLVNVLTTCGHTVGLRQSPSVVFSSTSDLAVEKQTGQTSSEEASLAEGLNTDGAKDELEPQQIMGVMTNFDFLNEELLESNEELAFPSWGDEGRRSSFEDSLDVRSIDKSTLRDMGSFSGSEPDLTPHESSDDDDEPRLTNCISESLPQAVAEATECSAIITQNADVVKISISSAEDEKTETLESKSPSVTSTESIPVPSRSGAGESYDMFHVTEYVCSTGDVESLWASHVPSVLKDKTGVTAVNTFSLFSCLYKVTRRKFYSLARESCNYLDERFRSVSQLFSDSMDYLMTRGDCPYVSVDTETLSQTKLLERHKFLVLELHSHLTIYIEKYDHTVECLDDIKLALKRSSVGSHSEEPEPRHAMDPEDLDQKHLQLCRCLYRTHFQFVLVCITYSRLLEALVQAATVAKVTDLTQDASEVKRKISAVLEHFSAEDIDTESVSFESPVAQVMEKLSAKETEQAVQLMRAFRQKFGDGGLFGTSDEDDVDTLVAFYCRHVSEKNLGSLVMSSSVQCFSALCSNLMEISVTILNALKDSGV